MLEIVGRVKKLRQRGFAEPGAHLRILLHQFREGATTFPALHGQALHCLIGLLPGKPAAIRAVSTRCEK